MFVPGKKKHGRHFDNGDQSPPIACRSVSRPFLFGSLSKRLIRFVLQKKDEKNLPAEKFYFNSEKPKAGAGSQIPLRPSLFATALKIPPYASSLDALRRFRILAATPARPVPSRNIVAGSGMGAGPWPSLKLVNEPVSLLVLA